MKLFRDLTVDYAKMITLIRKTIICQLYLIIKKVLQAIGHRNLQYLYTALLQSCIVVKVEPLANENFIIKSINC